MFIAVLFNLLLNTVALSIQDAFVLTSNSTPFPLLSYFSSASGLLKIDSVDDNAAIFYIEQVEFLFFIDITSDKSFLPLLNTLSTYFQTSYLTISAETSNFKLRASVHKNCNEEAAGLKLILDQQKVSQYILLSSSNYLDQQTSSLLADMTRAQLFSFLSYSEDLSQSVAGNLIRKMVKAKGISNLVIVDSSQALSTIEQMLIETKLNQTSSLLLYNARSFSQHYFEGSIFLADFNSTVAEDINEYNYLSIIQCLNFLNSNFPRIASKEAVTQALRLYKSQASVYTVYKVQGSKLEKAAEIYQDSQNLALNITNSSLLLVSDLAKVGTKLLFSIANGTHDPYYSFTYPTLAYMFEGANYAVYRSNLLKEIPNFYINLFPTDCGMFWYDPYWYYSCFAPVVEDLGIAMLTSFFEPAITGNILTLRELNHVIPQISPLGGSDTINNQTAFPEFVGLQTSTLIYESSQFKTLQSLGYTDIILITSNDTEVLYQSYLFYVETLVSVGMKIVNDEAHRFIPYSYNRSYFSNYSEFFQYIRNTRCTCFFIDIYVREDVIEALYDVGYRKGEFITIQDSNALNYLTGVEEPYYAKRKELVPGTLILSYREWIGELGEELEKEISAIYHEITYMCMTYDTVSVVKEAIIYLLSIGEDYENYELLMRTIRNNKITSCLGQVFFDPDGNYRSDSGFLIQEVIFNDTLQALGTINAAYVDRLSSEFITYIAEFEWPAGSAPPNYLPVNPCPFESFQIVPSDQGRSILYAMVILCVCAGLGTGTYAIFFYKEKQQLLLEKKIISFEDYFFLFYFVIEFFQFITMGPDQDAYKSVVNNFQILLSFNFDSYFNVTFAEFWSLLYVVIATTAVWILLFVLEICGYNKKFQTSGCWKRVGDISYFVLPLTVQLGFLPLVSMMLNIYICIYAIGDSATDSYLYQDCKTFCYTDSHKAFAVVCGMLLMIFIPLSVFYRPYFESAQRDLHILTSTWYLILTSWVQLIVIAFNKTLKEHDQNVHGIVITLILLVFVIVTMICKPHNYKRANVFHSTALVACVWAVGITTIFRNFGSISTWIAVEFLGILVILVIGGIFYKSAPEFLYSEPGKDISTLFLYQCCKNYQYYIKDPESLRFSSSEKYRENLGLSSSS